MTQNVLTFGCRLNFYESDLIKAELENVKDKDIVVVNTCAVTNEAENQVKQSIRRLHRQNPEKKIVVAGCAAQLKPDLYANMPGVFKVLGNIEKINQESYKSDAKIIVGDIARVKEQPIKPVRFTQNSRAFLQIQNGCDHDCTFCAITKARGNNRSIPVEVVVSEIKKMVDHGFLEVVLTGVDITDYGKDVFGKPSLSFLVKRILQDVKKLPRLRLSSIDVAETDDLLIDIIKNEERLMPHIHLSLQSGDAIILKRMKRRHSPEQILDFWQKATKARSNIGFGADIIAGFPTETDEQFKNTYNLIKDLQIPYLHVFPFSAKSGTKAALMPQIERSIAKERAKSLINLGDTNLRKFYKDQVNQIHNIVLEKDGVGRSENFCLVDVAKNKMYKRDTILKARITSYESKNLIGEIKKS